MFWGKHKLFNFLFYLVKIANTNIISVSHEQNKPVFQTTSGTNLSSQFGAAV